MNIHERYVLRNACVMSHVATYVWVPFGETSTYYLQSILITLWVKYINIVLLISPGSIIRNSYNTSYENVSNVCYPTCVCYILGYAYQPQVTYKRREYFVVTRYLSYVYLSVLTIYFKT